MQLRAEILDGSNASLAKSSGGGAVSVPVGAAPGNGSAPAFATLNLTVDSMPLWSLETPHLYHAVVTLLDASSGAVIDEVATRFAPRTVTISADNGLFLNGKHVKLQGVANHMDFAGVGNALPDRIQWFKVKAMKEMGVNAWRVSGPRRQR